ncbi:agmatine deiminase family protein [Isosphaeraceae bacterium EP7]
MTDPIEPIPGQRMPAEWEPHETTWIAWPHNREDWPGKFGPIPWVFVEVVHLLTQNERVAILVLGGKQRRDATERLERAGVDLGRVDFHKVKTDRIWTRDTAPTFVVAENETNPILVDWQFNGWAKYSNHKADDRLPRRLAKKLGFSRQEPTAEFEGAPRRIVLEGGSIDVNGAGTVLTTEECLLDDVQARNPGLSKSSIEEVLHRYLGTRHVIWLGKGIVGDDTHGHVDDLARFVGPRQVVTVVEKRESDENFEILADNRCRLAEARDQDGEPLEIIELPMPRPIEFEGQRLPASYANFYIANGMVLVPTFNDPADRLALSTLEHCFPGREVVGVHALDLVWGLGTLHCMTQQQPRVGTEEVTDRESPEVN